MNLNKFKIFTFSLIFTFVASIGYAADPKAKRILIDDAGNIITATNVEDALQEIKTSLSSINSSWGGITGTLSNQTDLQTALNAKQNTITTGTTAQYFRGDLSLSTFPTAVSSFTNDSGYALLVSPSFTTPNIGAATFTSLTGSNGESINNTGATDSIDIVGANTFRIDLDSQSISDAVNLSVTNGNAIEFSDSINLMSSLAIVFRDSGADRSTTMNHLDDGDFRITTSLGNVDIPETVTVTSLQATGTVTGSNLSGTNTGDQSEASIEALVDLQDLQGAVTDGQIPASITRDSEWDSVGEVETAWGSVNILLGTEIDTSSELADILTDETGTGLAVFGTSPRITTSLLDTNGVTWLAQTATASAVNYITLANAASLGTVSLIANGTDSNIPFQISPKGTSGVVIGGSVPTDASAGDFGYDGTQKAFKYGLGGGQDTFGVQTIFVQTASVTVASTAVETTLVGSGVGSATLNATNLTVGKKLRVYASGTYSNHATPPTLTLKVKMGSTVILTTPAYTLLTSSGSSLGWEVSGDIIVRTVGSSGTVFGQGIATIASTNAVSANVFMTNTATSTIDTTASQAISVTATWGTSDAANTITCTNFSIEELN